MNYVINERGRKKEKEGRERKRMINNEAQYNGVNNQYDVVYLIFADNDGLFRTFML